jgi:hypothetical protein
MLCRTGRRVSFVSVTRVVRTRCHAPFACISCVVRRLRVIINSLPLINTHVNNIDSSGRIFYIVNLRFARLICIGLIFFVGTMLRRRRSCRKKQLRLKLFVCDAEGCRS